TTIFKLSLPFLAFRSQEVCLGIFFGNSMLNDCGQSTRKTQSLGCVLSSHKTWSYYMPLGCVAGQLALSLSSKKECWVNEHLEFNLPSFLLFFALDSPH